MRATQALGVSQPAVKVEMMSDDDLDANSDDDEEVLKRRKFHSKLREEGASPLTLVI